MTDIISDSGLGIMNNARVCRIIDPKFSAFYGLNENEVGKYISDTLLSNLVNNEKMGILKENIKR